MTEKVSRDDYFTAAFELLAAGGKSALTTTAVCRRIGVTTGSLYHHFGSGAAFIGQSSTIGKTMSPWHNAGVWTP